MVTLVLPLFWYSFLGNEKLKEKTLTIKEKKQIIDNYHLFLGDNDGCIRELNILMIIRKHCDYMRLFNISNGWGRVKVKYYFSQSKVDRLKLFNSYLR